MLLRALGFIYLVAFLSLWLQLEPLIGKRGLLPATSFLGWVRGAAGTGGRAFWQVPTLFWLDSSDLFLWLVCGVGVTLAVALAAGLANVPIVFGLWFVYLSFVHVGQVFYSYGWEILLLECGFLAIFLVPLWKVRPFPDVPPPAPVFWLYRWVLFRLMFGAGLIKIRGDSCWTDLTCLYYHYETQPNPHPLSWVLHQAPHWFQQLGVLFNHFVELVVPFGVFGPKRVRYVAGALIILFQITLILSGNLSFLNWLTIACALSCFDDDLWRRLLPRRLRELAERRSLEDASGTLRPSGARRAVLTAWCILVAILSINPVVNLLGSRQRMNASFEPLHLVNTYGAFGTIGRQRFEVVIEGTDAKTLEPDTEWREYVIPCKPGTPDRAPCLVTPFHYRLQWQTWFAAMAPPEAEPWMANLVQKLLEGDRAVLRLIEKNPFPEAPPHYIRARLFRYRFTHFGEDGWWRRQPVDQYFRPLALGDPELEDFLKTHGFR